MLLIFQTPTETFFLRIVRARWNGNGEREYLCECEGELGYVPSDSPWFRGIVEV